jgi:hypothetical protein
MKHHVFLIVSIVIGFIFWNALSFFGLSFWLIILCMPLLAYAQIYASSRYNFRDSLKFEPIPPAGYEQRIRELDFNQQIWESLGFRKFDEFYMRISTDVVVYAYYHEQYPVQLCDYHMQSIKSCDLITNFDNQYSLTTANAKEAGTAPRPEKSLLQVFPDAFLPELLQRHLQAGQFLYERGFRVRQPETHSFREWFMESYMEAGKMFKNPLSPIKLIYWMATGHKQKYMKPVQQQFLAKLIQLP